MDELVTVLRKIYGEIPNSIIDELRDYRKTLHIKENPFPNTTWYEYLNLYFVYVDSVPGKEENSIRNLQKYLPYVKDLGCNALHILPFLSSPMIDRGFDVSDFMLIRKDLGTIHDMRSLVKEADNIGLKLFMDLVLNHISDQHMWFQKAVKGDRKYRDFFIVQKTKPIFVKRFHKDSAVWARYIVNDENLDVNIAFPEYTGEVPHWRQGDDGYWYYHTYYPNQPDVNWKNPQVFVEFAKIIMYWGSLGFNFRLDAIPFVGKNAYKEVDNNTDFTRNLIAALTMLVEDINPESVLIVETYEKNKTVIDYFGTTNRKQAKLGYNFHLCTQLWVSLVTQDATYLSEILKKEKNIPVHAEWLNFLRNHDELSLAYLDDDILKKIKGKLLKNGKSFREGYGISGRTYSLLGNSERRFLSAYLLLTSLPGGIVLPYGDEFGKTNLSDEQIPEPEKRDTRNINRGKLLRKEMESAKGKRIQSKIKQFLRKRKHLQEFPKVWPSIIHNQKQVFGCVYKSGSSELVIFINLSNKKQTITFSSEEFIAIQKLWKITIETDKIMLSPYSGVWLQK